MKTLVLWRKAAELSQYSCTHVITSLKEEKNGFSYQSLRREGHLLLVLVDLNMMLIFVFCSIFFINFDQRKIVTFYTW
jgi:hypothetical protein